MVGRSHLCGAPASEPHWMHACCLATLGGTGAAAAYPACPRCAHHRAQLRLGADDEEVNLRGLELWSLIFDHALNDPHSRPSCGSGRTIATTPAGCTSPRP